jgi:hypothetical protein
MFLNFLLIFWEIIQLLSYFLRNLNVLVTYVETMLSSAVTILLMAEQVRYFIALCLGFYVWSQGSDPRRVSEWVSGGDFPLSSWQLSEEEIRVSTTSGSYVIN